MPGKLDDILMPRPIFVVSDGTGDTAEKLVRAALLQFKEVLVHVRTFPNVTEPEQLDRLFRLASRERAVVVTTLVRSDMREAALSRAQEHRVRTVDAIGNVLSQLSDFLQAQPEGVPGRMHQADDAYFDRVAAVEFTVKADDGKEPRLLRNADIVLVGVSRTSKTPLSVFLAHKGYRVSNVPVVLDRTLPPLLQEIDQRKIFALTIDPESLRDIRRQRLQTMRVPGRTNYGDMDYILAELEWADELFRQYPHWPVIDVTRKAVEETAATIIKIMNDRGLSLDWREPGQL
ncbi:MAG: kinase/pyrophosphorylase [Alphaproteobacteria bacterium]|nr:kinase/pyrophosphorylase [Alphaproteobacteria bacterium]